MSNRPLAIAIAILISASILPATALAADGEETPTGPAFEVSPRFVTICKTSVDYSWTEVIEENEDDSDTASPATNAQKEKRQTEKKKEPLTRKIFFRNYFSREDTEEKAKSSLSELLVQGKADAYQACEKEHENTSLCIQRKLQASDGDYQLGDYKTRSVILKSVKKDCSLQRGICHEPTASETTCEKLQVGESYKKIEAPVEEEGKKKKKK
ncbi:MAG: hypothetical protein PHC51_09070 [bacterium]|nr:hypothetical protein [bacterium]